MQISGPKESDHKADRVSFFFWKMYFSDIQSKPIRQKKFQEIQRDDGTFNREKD